MVAQDGAWLTSQFGVVGRQFGRSKRQSRQAAASSNDRFAKTENPGAGEGARTLDPDLGKVVLYH
jgi:hypothetical protein